MVEPWTLAGILRTHAARGPDRPMITCGDRAITWGRMRARACRVAQALRAEGVGAQDRVAFVGRNAPEYFEVLFGGAMLNAVNVAVNWRLTPREMAHIVADAGARVLVVGTEFLPHIAEIAGSLATVRTIIALGTDSRHRDYESWLGDHGEVDPLAEVAPDDVAMQLYTSGTTGVPKGAMLTSANLGALVPRTGPAWGIDGAAVTAVAMPLFHIGGSAWALVGMHAGAHTILFREFVPGDVLAALGRHRVTHALFVPAMLQSLTAVPAAAHGDYGALRAIVYGASPITNEVLIRSMKVFGCDFIQLYGLTETTGGITQLDPGDHDPSGPRTHLLRSAGKPFPWVDLRVVDPATGEDCPPGQIGELWTRSPQNMKGYWNRAEETAAVLGADGWLRTGDAGYLDAEGYVYLTDRVKDMIISGGENIYPAEVENALADHPAIADVAVIGVPDPRWGETVKAIVVRAPGADPAPGEIIAFARARLAHFKCPTSVDFAASLPRNPSGKLLKRELREPYWAGHVRRIH